jgi:hypothetical protein
MSCNNIGTCNTEDTLAKINRQIAQTEQYIELLLHDIDMEEINAKGRMDCAIKIMSIYQRLLMMHERSTKSSTDDMSEAQKAQQSALTDIMRLLEDECSSERPWHAPEEGEE